MVLTMIRMYLSPLLKICLRRLSSWEPKESFVGSEHMIEQFWERANTSGRDYQDLSLFKIGEEFDLTGPPRE